MNSGPMFEKQHWTHHTHADRNSPAFDGPVHSHPGYPQHDHEAIDRYMEEHSE